MNLQTSKACTREAWMDGDPWHPFQSDSEEEEEIEKEVVEEQVADEEEDEEEDR